MLEVTPLGVVVAPSAFEEQRYGTAPGDLVRGDADGVVVLPSAHEDAILDAAEEISRAEDAIRALAGKGARLDEARRQFGYHRLQSLKDSA